MSINFETAPRPSSLAKQIEAQTQDLEWTLANYAFVASVTSLASVCDVAHSPGMSVASCHRLPLTSLAFVGHSADLLANYATFLTNPGSDVYISVNESQREIVTAAFDVQEVIARWQMVFRGDIEALDSGTAVPLAEQDESAMRTLANTGGLTLLEHDPLAVGPAFGVRRGRRLLAMATTCVQVPGAVQIGNAVTHKDQRRKGYARASISALVKDLATQDVCVFIQVHQDRPNCIALYKKLGFEIIRPMYLIRCIVKNEVQSKE